MIDFGIWYRDKSQIKTCNQYGTLRDHNTGKKIKICGNKQRTQFVYTSRTYSLDVTLNAVGDNSLFLIKYEGMCIRQDAVTIL